MSFSSSSSPRTSSMVILKNNNRKPRHYNKHGGVGLGIVVALDKSNFATGTTAGEILVKYAVVGAPPSPRSDPIQVVSSGDHKRRICDEVKADYDDDEENFTYVTRRELTRSITRVYHHKAEVDESRRRRRALKPPVFKVEQEADEQVSRSDFLQSCDLCRKPLLGKDIYMYRGERAFCSEECRQKQIASDERKEKLCGAEAKKSSPSAMVSRSPCYYERGQIFSTGIVAI